MSHALNVQSLVKGFNGGVFIQFEHADGSIASRQKFDSVGALLLEWNKEDNQFIKKLGIECSRAGDKRGSAFGAKVTINGVTDIIENWYQLSKCFNEKPMPPSPRDPYEFKKAYLMSVKGKVPDYINVLGYKLETRFLTSWYNMLWVLHLDANPELVRYFSNFDVFNDIYYHGKGNCQAKVIERYVKEGRENIMSEYREMLDLLAQGSNLDAITKGT